MAVSHMVSSGDLVREGQDHVIAPRLVERKRRLKEGLSDLEGRGRASGMSS